MPCPTCKATAQISYLKFGRKPEVLSYWSATFWCWPVDAAPLATNSAAVVADLAGKAASFHGWINVMQSYDTPFFIVSSTTPRVRIGFDDAQHKGYTPSWMYATGGPFINVPVPPEAQAASGTDGAIGLWDPATGELWEFWKFAVHGPGWLDRSGVESTYSASFGGYMKMSTNPGYYTTKGGVTATKLPIPCTNIGFDEMSKALATNSDLGRAIGFSVPYPRSGYLWPAQAGDGGSSTSLVTEGMRFRLRPDFDVEGYVCHPALKVMLRTIAKYGMICKDKAGSVTFTTESLAPIAAANNGANPWTQIFDQPIGQIMSAFPWKQLELIDSTWRAP